MACLIITRMGNLLFINFPTIEAAYFTGAKLVIRPTKYTTIINEITIKSLFTIGLDSELHVQMYIGNGNPIMEGEINLIEYITPLELVRHPIYRERISLLTN